MISRTREEQYKNILTKFLLRGLYFADKQLDAVLSNNIIDSQMWAKKLRFNEKIRKQIINMWKKEIYAKK